MCAHYIFYNFSQVIFYYMPKNCIFALQINAIFPMCVCVLSKIKISHSNIIPIYYCGAAQDRRGGSNRPWAYRTYGKRKLGSNRHRWRDTAIMQFAISAQSLFVLYHIYKFSPDSYTLFDDGNMCECTQIYYEKCDDVSEYSCEKCEWWWLWY